jgi:hypothetical protein
MKRTRWTTSHGKDGSAALGEKPLTLRRQYDKVVRILP